MRILYSHRINSRDGQAIHVEELIRALRAGGHEVEIIGPSFYKTTEFGGESKIIAHARKFLPAALWELAELAYAMLAYRRLLRAYRQFKPDFIYERCNLYHLAGALLARLHGAKLLLEVNSPLAEERKKHGGLKFFRLARALEHFTWRQANTVLPVTEVLAEIIEKSGVPKEKIKIIPNAINLESFTAKPEPKSPGAAITLGFVGFVRPWHGLDRVIAGMARCDQRIFLTIVGDGPIREDLEHQAKSLGIADRVNFTGVVAPHDVPREVEKFDIALQPMATPYASPLKIFDYMAASCAIVAPDQPNISEILEHPKTALLFDPADPDAMWKSVLTLIETPDLRTNLGHCARAELEQKNYTWSANAARVIRIALSS